MVASDGGWVHTDPYDGGWVHTDPFRGPSRPSSMDFTKVLITLTQGIFKGAYAAAVASCVLSNIVSAH